MPSTIKTSDVLKPGATKKSVNLTLTTLKRATAKTLKPTKLNVTQFEEQEIKAQRRRKTLPSVNIISMPEPIQPVVPEQLTPTLDETKKADLANQISTELTAGKFPTDRDFMIKQIGLNDLGDNLNKLRDWISNNSSSSIRWKENYIKAIDNSMESALMFGDAEAYDSLQRLRDLITEMDMEDYLLGQLVKPEQLAIDYVYPVKGSTSPWAGRVDRIISEWENLYK